MTKGNDAKITGKKIKIYVDEDLILERQMIELMAKTGQEMCK